MRKIEIWGEGLCITGVEIKACKLGEYDAMDFDDAMEQYIAENPNLEIHKHDDGGSGNYTNWGIRHFDNELDARKNFG